MFKQGKKSEELCEDECYISDDFVAVIDGVTSKSDFLYEGQTTGKIAAKIIKEVLETMPRDIRIGTVVSEINRRINEIYKMIAFPYSKEEKGIQAACVIYSDYYREIWLVGDCQFSVDGKVYMNPKVSDIILSNMRSLILHIMEEGKQKKTLDEVQQMARNIVEPWILQSTVFANNAKSEYGYAVINGQEIPEQLIKIVRLDHNPHMLIMTSDGYPMIEDNLEKSEEYLKMILKSDQACYKSYKSTKGMSDGCRSFDDRTYVRFLVEKV